MAPSSLLDNQSLTVDAINLSRALQRLEAKILSPKPNPRLLRSNFERAKTAANLDYARTLLLRLEHATSSIKVQSRKQTVTNELLSQRALIKRLNDRLFELGQENGVYSDESSGEDILGDDSNTASSKPHEPISTKPSSSPSLSKRKPETTHQIPAPALTSTLRNRLNAQSSSSSTTSSSQPQPPTASLLAHNDSEQTTLIASVTALASALKQSQIAFAANLEAEKPLLDLTSQSLDKNTDGLAAAEKRMGMLRRMSEGKGWWGRIMLYAWIAGLWVGAIILVFVGPKLRF